MKSTVTSLLLLLTVGAASSLAADAVVRAMQPRVDDGTMAGAVFLIANRDRILSCDALGYADLDAKQPMRADSLFWIASTTKLFTSACVMMLVDEGKISLDDPVEKYLPEFKDMKFKDKGANGEPRPVSHALTISELLSNSSGLPFSSPAEKPGLDRQPLSERVSSYAKETLLFDPGTDYAYSNENFNTAGRIIELAGGMKYENFLQQRLLTPLGMKDTTFWPDKEQVARLAKSYKFDTESNKLVPGKISALHAPYDNRNGRYPIPAGGLFSTAADVAKFARMLLNGGELDGKRYLKQDSVALMAKQHAPTNPYGFGCWVKPGKGQFGHGGAYGNEVTIDRHKGFVAIFMVQRINWGNKELGEKISPDFQQLAEQFMTQPEAPRP
ncbi:MAG: beta-lactamase family protein [Verrucomicrobiales bacterium]|jgi:CubicO group peptidase (beta-lactamase class C family)|nr:beta-lactamase family protein [Verrucomicrobiales bacterium]